MEKKLKDMGVELNELAIAMCDYIQTGQKTEQLSKFWDNEDSFYMVFPELCSGLDTTSIGAMHHMGVETSSRKRIKK